MFLLLHYISKKYESNYFCIGTESCHVKLPYTERAIRLRWTGMKMLRLEGFGWILLCLHHQVAGVYPSASVL